MFFQDIFERIIISNTEYDTSGNSNFSFHVGASKFLLNLLFLHDFFTFFHVQ